MELFWAMFIFFMIITAVFLVIAFVFPEWVGITGKAALKIQEHQRGDHDDTPETTAPEAAPDDKK